MLNLKNSNIEWTMYLDGNLEINRIDLNGSISEDTG
jgi:hypothetical protein